MDEELDVDSYLENGHREVVLGRARDDRCWAGEGGICDGGVQDCEWRAKTISKSGAGEFRLPCTPEAPAPMRRASTPTLTETIARSHEIDYCALMCLDWIDRNMLQR